MPDGSILELFGSGGGQAAADALSDFTGTKVSLIGQVPLSVELRTGSDSGNPVVRTNPKDPASIEIAKIAQLLIESKLPVNRTLKVDIA